MTFPIRKLTGIVKNTIPEVFPEMKPHGNVIIFPVGADKYWRKSMQNNRVTCNSISNYLFLHSDDVTLN